MPVNSSPEILKCIVDGKEIDSASGEYIDVIGVNGKCLAKVPNLTRWNLISSVGAATKAFYDLKKYSVDSILDIFREVGKNYSNDSRYDRSIALAKGNTLKYTVESRQRVADMFQNFGLILDSAFGDRNYLKNGRPINGESRIFYRPIGIVSAIPSATSREIVPHTVMSAIGVGNAIDLKLDSGEPFSGIELAKKLYDAGMPAGSVNALTWQPKDRPELGYELIENSDSCVFFGRRQTIIEVIYKSLLGNIPLETLMKLPLPEKIINFEEGRSKALVDKTADIDKAAKEVIRGATEVPIACMKTQFVVVEKSVSQQFKDLCLHYVERLRIGDLTDSYTDVGHVHPDNVPYVKSVIKNAKNFEARILFGNEDELEHKPMILVEVHPQSLLIKEETPAPTLGIIDVDDLKEGIKLINNSVSHTQTKMSLKVACFTNNEENYELIRRSINAYNIHHNRSTIDINPLEPHQGIYLPKDLTKIKSA